MTATDCLASGAASLSGAREPAAAGAPAAAHGSSATGDGASIRDLRLVPFPKRVALSAGRFALERRMSIVVSDSPVSCQVAGDLREELAAVTGATCDVQPVAADEGPLPWFLVLSAEELEAAALRQALGALPEQDEGYALVVSPQFAAVGARTAAGLVWGMQTLRQLVVANLQGGSLPRLRIDDWPSLRYRGFQDDITRGRSSLPATMKREIRMGSLLKMNFFTYYMEDQFAFAKHPDIGPRDGSLQPQELTDLVAYARLYNSEIIGSQQSFAHFGNILAKPAYAPLGETPGVLDPTNEGTYRLLDDMYSEEIPLTDSEFFNVCCDETTLGTGPCKALVEKIGVGGVYARHIKRLHDLVTGKYGKRMMIWGDIIVSYPQNLGDIPKDTVMLAWDYGPRESFDHAIVPLVQAGFDFFVCPCDHSVLAIVPNYDTAAVNIRNFVRDGARLGALGMLNTTWNDDAETFVGNIWHGVAWGAECAWNASATSLEDFNRRVGAVLFGESGDHYGRAVTLLGKVHHLPCYPTTEDPRLLDWRFWRGEWVELPADRAEARARAQSLLDIVEPGLAHLRAAQQEAKVNADLLDYVIFGAERLELMATRCRDLLDAAEAYEQAQQAPDAAQSAPRVEQALRLMTAVRERHLALKERCRELWLRESRPYTLDVVMARYDALIGRYDEIVVGLQEALAAVRGGRALPDAGAFGLKPVEHAPPNGA